MKTRTIRLSPFVAVVPVGTSVFIRSDLKSFALSGEGVKEFVRRAIPLLDGSHDAAAIVKVFPEYGAKSIRALLAELERLGVVESASPAGGRSTSGPDPAVAAYLASWAGGGQGAVAVADAHVMIIGSNRWSTVACEELVRAGVGRLTVLEVARAGRSHGAREDMPTALVRHLRKMGSSTTVDRHVVTIEKDALSFPTDDAALLLLTAHPDEIQVLDAAVRASAQRRLRYLIGHVEGTSAMLGPAVVPGETACWECFRNRRLANQPNFHESAVLQAGFRAGARAGRRALNPPGAASVLGGLIATEAIKLITGSVPSQIVGRRLEFDLVTMGATMHGLVRLPWCSVCGGAGGAGGPESASSGQGRTTSDEPSSSLSASPDPAALRDRLVGIVDGRYGIVQHLVVNHPSPDEPQSMSTATALIAGPAVPGHHHSDALLGSGKGTNKVAAMVGAVGEAIERYSASIYRESDLVRASPKELGGRAFDPASLCLYLPEQYGQPGFDYDPYDPAREISWTEAKWLDSGEPILVPSLVTYFNYRARHGEQLCQVTSSGLAAGASFEDAALRATMELIERDAFMMTWLQRRPPQRVAATEELGADIVELLAELNDLGMDCQLYLLNGDVGIPTFMCIAWGDGKSRPSATVALAAHFDPLEAARKAILEQAHVGPYIARLMADPAQKIPGAPEDVRILNDHALFYVPRKRLRAFDFIRSGGGRPRSLSGLKRPIGSGTDVCLDALAAGGFRVAVADVTSPDVRLGPFRVARALGTYMQPIDFGYQKRRLANPRLRGPRALNPDPHPLA